MTDNNFLADFATGAKKNIESVALIAANAGLKVLTPERVDKIDNLKLADKLRGAVDKGASSLRVSVAEAKLKAAQEEADAAKEAKKRATVATEAAKAEAAAAKEASEKN